MKQMISHLVDQVVLEIFNYLPRVVASLLLLLVGWFVAWLIKRLATHSTPVRGFAWPGTALR